MKSITKSGTNRWTLALMAVLGTALGVTVPRLVHGDDAAPATVPAARTTAVINADIRVEYSKIDKLMSDPSTMTDSAKRAAAAPQVIPVLKKLVADYSALEVADPFVKEEVAHTKGQYVVFLSLMGDTDSTGQLQTEAESKDPEISLTGKMGQLMVDWLNAGKDNAAEDKIINTVEKLARANAASTELTTDIYQMSQMGMPDKPQVDRLNGLVTDVMKNEVADALKAQIASEHKLDTLEGKPMVVAGKLLDGKDFTTADLKGKVILVDFWATWCGPCMAEMPRVKRIYADYHDKGLEVIGVSNDQAPEDVTKFCAANKDAPWPQLFDAAAAQQQQLNSVAAGFGIDSIPQLFLIDKKGICRSVSGRANLEELIPKMLSE